MRRVLVNLALFFLAVILLMTLGVFGLIYTIVYSIRHRNTLSFYEYWGDLLYSINIGIDRIGNVLLAAFLNNTAIKTKRYPFGIVNHTISHVLAYNYFNYNLTWFGYFLVKALESLDKGHMKKAL